MNLVITKGESMPKYRGYYVSHPEIAKLVKKVFSDKTEYIERSQFIVLYQESRAITDTISHFSQVFDSALKLHKSMMFDRLHYRAAMRKIFMDMIKNV